MAMAMEERSPMLNGSSGGINGSATQIHTATRTPTSQTGTPFTCSGCGKHIVDKFLLKALDVYWHEDCLKCGCCDCRLGEVGSTLYTRANLILCKRDYLRLFGTSGSCAACCKVIPAFEMVMRAKNNVYHLECFACSCCQQRFCVGDRFYLMDNKILCEYDYEERLIFASMHTSAASQIQRRVTDIQSGNGAIGGGLLPNRGFGHTLMEAPFGPAALASPTSSAFLPRDGATALKPFLAHQPLPPHPHYPYNSTALKRPAPSSVQKERHSPSDGSSSGYGSPDSALLLMDDR